MKEEAEESCCEVQTGSRQSHQNVNFLTRLSHTTRMEQGNHGRGCERVMCVESITARVRGEKMKKQVCDWSIREIDQTL